jgi:hypothetical protein
MDAPRPLAVGDWVRIDNHAQHDANGAIGQYLGIEKPGANFPHLVRYLCPDGSLDLDTFTEEEFDPDEPSVEEAFRWMVTELSR